MAVENFWGKMAQDQSNTGQLPPEPVKVPDGGLKVNDDVMAVVRIDARRNGTTRVIKPGALGRVKGWSLKGWWVTFIFNGGRQMDVLISSDQVKKISSEYGGKIF